MVATAGLPIAALAQSAAVAQPPSASTAPTPAPVSAPPPPGLIGAWGGDSSCTADVAVFRADGTVLNPAAPPGTPPLSYSINGDSITLSQGTQSGTFAFALSDQAVAWSNGSAIVLKERCADQSPFAADLKAAAASPTPPAPVPAGALPDQLRMLAGQPVPFQGGSVQIQSVVSDAPKKAIYVGVIARPDPQAIGGDARLFYRIFPTPAAAADYVSLDVEKATSFLREPHGSGF
ncbi:MAG TPA: hypothetical protein VFE31_09790, partial [Opitutaceae bacterium]|nr:hypothetical protein [Opitutaceae bacterium]